MPGEGQPDGGMSGLLFASIARRLVNTSRELGLAPPAFRSPPRTVGETRTIRRVGGGCVVSVAIRDRAPMAVARDMAEGVVAASDPADPEAAVAALLESVADLIEEAEVGQ